jgi:putative membrane protein
MPALAQTSGSSTTMQPGAAGGSTMGNMAGQMGQAEMQHMQQTMQLGMVAMETSRIAMNKARNEDLKRFANFEVQEQTTLSEVLRSMMEPAATAATGAQSGTPMPGNMPMDAQARDMVQKLQNQQAGAEFDKAYLEGQIQGHRDLLQVQERYIQSNSQNREHMNVARMARTQIREHIAMLEDMQKTLR